jgi:hypothetical protein
MPIDFLLERFAGNPDGEALVWRHRIFDYRWLLGRIEYWARSWRGERSRATVVLLEETITQLPGSALRWFDAGRSWYR